MKHKNFEFENEFRKVYSNINKECKINEVQLFDTNIRIYVFCIREEIYISLKNILDIIEYFIDSKLDEECFEHAKSLLQTYKLVELDLDVENKDLDVCKASDITNQVFDKITERQKYASQETEDLLFNRIDMSSSTNDTQSLSDKPLNTMYPFIPSWNDSAMNDILQNIYSSNDYKDSSTAVEDTVGKKYMGRGRCRVKQANLKERPFVCEYPDCKRAFKRYEHLKRHNKMHTGERPYKCGYPGCMKAFSRSDNLSQHFKIHNVPHKGHTLNFRSYQYINKD